MAFTQTDLDAINKAIASGVLEVEFDDEKIKYNSISELLKAKNIIKSELDASANETSGGTVSRRPFAVVSRYKRNL